jgi:hypothetical protein
MFSLLYTNGSPSSTSLPLTILREPSLPAATSVAPGASLPSAAARATWTAA